MKLWIARDFDGVLNLYVTKPSLDSIDNMYYVESDMEDDYLNIDKELFPEVTFENSPQEVELKLCGQTETIKIANCTPKTQPYKENKEFKVGDIVLYEGPLTKGIMIIGSFDYGDGTKPEAARAVIGESISIKTGSSAIYPNFSPSINNIRHATDDEVIDFVNKEEFQGYLNFYKDWLLKHCSRLVNLGLLNKF